MSASPFEFEIEEQPSAFARTVAEPPTTDDSPFEFETTTPTRKRTRSSGHQDLDALYERYGTEHGVDSDLLIEQGRQETINFNPKVIAGKRDSPKGARGVAQFMPDTAREFGLRVDESVDDRRDPEKSISAQARLMKKLLDRHGGNTEASLAAYNSGHNLSTGRALRNRQRVPETRGYVDRITAALSQQEAGRPASKTSSPFEFETNDEPDAPEVVAGPQPGRTDEFAPYEDSQELARRQSQHIAIDAPNPVLKDPTAKGKSSFKPETVEQLLNVHPDESVGVRPEELVAPEDVIRTNIAAPRPDAQRGKPGVVNPDAPLEVGHAVPLRVNPEDTSETVELRALEQVFRSKGLSRERASGLAKWFQNERINLGEPFDLGKVQAGGENFAVRFDSPRLVELANQQIANQKAEQNFKPTTEGMVAGVTELAEQITPDIIDQTAKKAIARLTGYEVTSDRVAQAYNSVQRGIQDFAISTLQSVPLIASTIDGSDVPADKMPLYVLLESVREQAHKLFPNNPKLQEEYIATKIPEGIGSSIAFLAIGAATGGMGAVAGGTGIAAAGALSQLTSMYQEAKAKGATEAQAREAMWWGIPIGASEVVGVGSAARRLNALTGGTLKGITVEGLKAALKRAGVEILKETGEEAFQNTGQGIASAAVAKHIYDSNRNIFGTVKEDLIVGVVSAFLMSGVASAPGVLASISQPSLQDKLGARTPPELDKGEEREKPIKAEPNVEAKPKTVEPAEDTRPDAVVSETAAQKPKVVNRSKEDEVPTSKVTEPAQVKSQVEPKDAGVPQAVQETELEAYKAERRQRQVDSLEQAATDTEKAAFRANIDEIDAGKKDAEYKNVLQSRKDDLIIEAALDGEQINPADATRLRSQIESRQEEARSAAARNLTTSKVDLGFYKDDAGFDSFLDNVAAAKTRDAAFALMDARERATGKAVNLPTRQWLIDYWRTSRRTGKGDVKPAEAGGDVSGDVVAELRGREGVPETPRVATQRHLIAKKIGDFYEFFGEENAQRAAELTGRRKTRTTDGTPTIGVPGHDIARLALELRAKGIEIEGLEGHDAVVVEQGAKVPTSKVTRTEKVTPDTAKVQPTEADVTPVSVSAEAEAYYRKKTAAGMAARSDTQILETAQYFANRAETTKDNAAQALQLERDWREHPSEVAQVESEYQKIRDRRTPEQSAQSQIAIDAIRAVANKRGLSIPDIPNEEPLAVQLTVSPLPAQPTAVESARSTAPTVLDRVSTLVGEAPKQVGAKNAEGATQPKPTPEQKESADLPGKPTTQEIASAESQAAQEEPLVVPESVAQPAQPAQEEKKAQDRLRAIGARFEAELADLDKRATAGRVTHYSARVQGIVDRVNAERESLLAAAPAGLRKTLAKDFPELAPQPVSPSREGEWTTKEVGRFKDETDADRAVEENVNQRSYKKVGNEYVVYEDVPPPSVEAEKPKENAREIDDSAEHQFRDQYGDESVQAVDKLYEDKLGKELTDKVLSGEASEEEKEQFEQLAREHGLSDQSIDAIIKEGERTRRSDTEATRVQSSAGNETQGRVGDAEQPQLTDDQLEQGYTLSDDGTLTDPDGQPLFSHEQQLGFTQEGLLQQEAQESDRGRLTIPKSEETTGTLGQLRQSKDERVSRIATLLAKFQRYGVSDLAVADLTAALEAYSYLRSNKFTVEEYLRQGSLFGPTQQLSSVQEGMLKAYETLKPAPLADAIKTYIRQLADGKAEFNGKPEDEVVEAALFERAFHGSPYTFDKFSSEKIGTGEGAQVYGYGLYFTDKKEIAEFYKGKLQPGAGVSGADIAARIYESLPDSLREEGKRESTIKELERRRHDLENNIGFKRDDLYVKRISEAIEAVHKGTFRGKVYEVELAPKEDEYLLWDKPLSEQSEKVKKALDNAATNEDVPAELRRILSGPKSRHFHGSDLQSDIVNIAAHSRLLGVTVPPGDPFKQQAASQFLHSLGIRGIKYLDQGSRSAGDGTYNYVIFSDADVSIEAMYRRGDLRRLSDADLLPRVEVEQRGHLVALNPAAYELLRRSYGRAYGQKVVDFTGVFNDPTTVDRVVAELRRLAREVPKQKRTLVNLARKFRTAAGSDGTVIAFRTQAAVPHEGRHRGSFLASEGKTLRDRHGEIERVVKTAAYGKIAPQLIRLGEPNVGPRLVEEAQAYIGEGDYKRFGITVDEAEDFMEAWAASFIAANGPQSMEQFRAYVVDTMRLLNELEKQRDTNRSADTTNSEQRGQDLRGTTKRGTPRSPASLEGDRGGEGGGEGGPVFGARGRAALFKRDSHQVDSPEFKKWFGQSKVVDENGNPLVVYHGTKKDFSEFQPQEKQSNPYLFDDKGLGSFFDVRPGEATDWRDFYGASGFIGLRQDAGSGEIKGPEGAQIIPAYLSLQNPKEYEYTEYTIALNEGGGGAKLKSRLQGEGYDGIIRNSHGEPLHLIAFEPTQIKSAVGNRGTFDADNPNILFKRDDEDLDPRQRVFKALLNSKQQELQSPAMPSKKRAGQPEGLAENAQAPQTSEPPKVTDSREFKDWFKDSAITDEQGKPLLLFHGTQDPSFKPQTVSKPIQVRLHEYTIADSGLSTSLKYEVLIDGTPRPDHRLLFRDRQDAGTWIAEEKRFYQLNKTTKQSRVPLFLTSDPEIANAYVVDAQNWEAFETSEPTGQTVFPFYVKERADNVLRFDARGEFSEKLTLPFEVRDALGITEKTMDANELAEAASSNGVTVVIDNVTETGPLLYGKKRRATMVIYTGKEANIKSPYEFAPSSEQLGVASKLSKTQPTRNETVPRGSRSAYSRRKPNESRPPNVARTPEDLQKQIEQLNKFAQANAIRRRTGGLTGSGARGARGQYIFGSGEVTPEGEIRLRAKDIKSAQDYVEVLSHELGHSIEAHVTGSLGERTFRVFGENLDPATVITLRRELQSVTEALEGAEEIAKHPQYYNEPSELLARFFEKMIVAPGNLEEIAPTASRLIREQQVVDPVVREFLEAADNAIDKGQRKTRFLPDLRELHENMLGKRVGDLAYGELMSYRAMRARAAMLLTKFIAKKFQGVKDDGADLFRAAEAIKVTRSDVPEFGTRDFANAVNEKEAEQLLTAGWEPLVDDDGEAVMDVVNGVAAPRYFKVRYTPEQAKEAFEALSPEGKRLISDFTAAREEAKDYFNREMIKDVHGINSNLEGWVHHYFDDSPTTVFSRVTKLKERIAGSRKHREGAEGYIEDFRKAMTKAMVELDTEKAYNDFINRYFSRVSKPLPEGTQPDKGWTEVTGDMRKGIKAPGEGQTLVVVKDGKTFVPRRPRYQMPDVLYTHLQTIRNVAGEASLANRIVNDLNRYWRINVLTHPGTAMTNAISGGIQYSVKVLDDFYSELLSGDVGLPQTRRNIYSMLTVLTPKGWQNAPDWIYGGDQSNFYGQFQSPGVVSESIDKYANVTLKLFGTVERYWKKALATSERGHELLSLNEVKREGLRLPTKDERMLLAELNQAVDLHGYDYDNVPAWLEAHQRSVVGQSIKPFAKYPYKYSKHISKMLGGAFDPTLPWQARTAKILALGTVMGLYALYHYKRDDEVETPPGDAETPARISPRGRTFIGKDSEGKEMFVRTAKYPFINVTEASIQLANGEYEEAKDIMTDMLGSIGPGGEIGALLVFNMRNKYEQYTPVPVILGDQAVSFVPGFRLWQDMARMADPYQRKKERFSQSFTSLIPTTDPEQQEKWRGPIRTVKVPIEREVTAKPGEKQTRTTTDEQLRNNPRDVLLSMLTGVYVTRIDPKIAKAVAARKTKNEEEREKKALAEQDGPLSANQIKQFEVKEGDPTSYLRKLLEGKSPEDKQRQIAEWREKGIVSNRVLLQLRLSDELLKKRAELAERRRAMLKAAEERRNALGIKPRSASASAP